VHVNLHRPPVDTLFTYPSVYTLAPTVRDSCRNADALFSPATGPCAKGAFPTGVNCNDTACGRPRDWPPGEPFYLPLDLQDPDVWLSIGAAQPTLEEVTAEEDAHMRVRLHRTMYASTQLHQ
jgi:hypothetical protein